MLTRSGSAHVMVDSRQGGEWQEFGEVLFRCKVPPAFQPAIARTDCIILHTSDAVRESNGQNSVVHCLQH